MNMLSWTQNSICWTRNKKPSFNEADIFSNTILLNNFQKETLTYGGSTGNFSWTLKFKCHHQKLRIKIAIIFFSSKISLLKEKSVWSLNKFCLETWDASDLCLESYIKDGNNIFSISPEKRRNLWNIFECKRRIKLLSLKYLRTIQL